MIIIYCCFVFYPTKAIGYHDYPSIVTSCPLRNVISANDLLLISVSIHQIPKFEKKNEKMKKKEEIPSTIVTLPLLPLAHCCKLWFQSVVRVGCWWLSICFMFISCLFHVYFRVKASQLIERRVRLMSEIINGINAIKTSCWEKPFNSALQAARR